jgi:hypothetical protein
LIWINGIGRHLARDHALGEIGTVALRAPSAPALSDMIEATGRRI